MEGKSSLLLLGIKFSAACLSAVEGQHKLSQQVADLRNHGFLEFLQAKHSLGVGRRQQSGSFTQEEDSCLQRRWDQLTHRPAGGFWGHGSEIVSRRSLWCPSPPALLRTPRGVCSLHISCLGNSMDLICQLAGEWRHAVKMPVDCEKAVFVPASQLLLRSIIFSVGTTLPR